ncbi:MAG TPA: hypothetical protein VK467_10335 [Gemmatimonadales bacterium]|nr:hypothetical protein [Gemmatimonadales bacterium]
MAGKTYSFAWTRCRGMNTWDTPLDVPADQGTDVLNMHFYDGGIGTKRAGSSNQTPTGGGFFGITALTRFVPGQDDAAAEVIFVSADGPAKFMRVAGGTLATELTVVDPVGATDAAATVFLTFNGKLFVAYDSDVNRLHVLDPGSSPTTIRRVGLLAPGPLTGFANIGSGSYPATPRYYRVAFIEIRAGVIVRRSNTSASSVVVTPSGTGLLLRIDRPPLVGEGETHWELYGSTDDALFYGPLATMPIATLTHDDISTPSTWATAFDAEPSIGATTPWPSVRFLATDGTHLVGLGVYETTAGGAMEPKPGRVYFSPALDSSGVHDDERVSNTTTIQGWIDLSRNAAGIDRGLARLGNTIYAFQSRGIYMLVPTSDAETPFRRITLSTQLGAESHLSLVEGEDEAGRAALYFLDPELGPYRIGVNGLQWIGKDVKAIWDTVNHDAERGTAHGVYYKSRHQVQWWIATGGNNECNTVLVFDVTEGTANAEGVRYGWSRYTGTYAAARASAMLPASFGAVMSRALKPYTAATTFFGTLLLRGDDPTMRTDVGTAYQAYVQSRALTQEPLYVNKAVLKSFVHAGVSPGVTLTQTFIRGEGDETPRVAHVVLTAQSGEGEVFPRFEAAALADAYAFQVRLGDQVAVDKLWTLNRWYGVIEMREDR